MEGQGVLLFGTALKIPKESNLSSERAHLQKRSGEAALQAAATATSLKPFKIRIKRYPARAGRVA